MTTTAHGRIQSGSIVLDTPLNLPDGIEVDIRVRVVDAPIGLAAPEGEETSFFGMWKDRDDLADSSAWVAKEREEWGSRFGRKD